MFTILLNKLSINFVFHFDSLWQECASVMWASFQIDRGADMQVEARARVCKVAIYNVFQINTSILLQYIYSSEQ